VKDLFEPVAKNVLCLGTISSIFFGRRHFNALFRQDYRTLIGLPIGDVVMIYSARSK
jgi:hypothetical protein